MLGGAQVFKVKFPLSGFIVTTLQHLDAEGGSCGDLVRVAATPPSPPLHKADPETEDYRSHRTH